MSVVTQLYFQIVEENNYVFRPFSGWAIVRLRLEYRRNLIYYNVDIKNGGTRSRFTMFGEVLSCNHRRFHTPHIYSYALRTYTEKLHADKFHQGRQHHRPKNHRCYKPSMLPHKHRYISGLPTTQRCLHHN
jgi:hypothetical protein